MRAKSKNLIAPIIFWGLWVVVYYHIGTAITVYFLSVLTFFLGLVLIIIRSTEKDNRYAYFFLCLLIGAGLVAMWIGVLVVRWDSLFIDINLESLFF